MLLKVGSTGTDVKRVQKLVGVAQDGAYGPKTVAAVKVWQKAHHLIIDGVIGPLTWAKMFPPVAVSKPAPKPTPVTPPKSVPKPAPVKRLAGHKFYFDIGHGMNNTGPGVFDPGACAAGWQEHVKVEAFVNDLTAAVRSQGGTVTVIHDVALGKRVSPSSVDGTSFHMNATKGGTGTEVWIPLLAGPKSRAKSDKIGRAVAMALGLPYRGTKRTMRLSITNHGWERLIELMFIDSAKDRAAFTAKRGSAINAIVNCL